MQDSADRTPRGSAGDLIADKPYAWAAVILVPILTFVLLRDAGLGTNHALFVAIAGVTVLLWMFSLVPDFIPALLGLLMLVLFGVAPQEVVLSGFSSPGFLLAVSVMGLGAVIGSSGLTRRYTLFLIRHLPQNTFAHQAAAFFTGLLFTPIVPAITGRAVIVAPVLGNIAQGWDPETRHRSETALYASGLHGINLLSPMFLTAAPANFMIFGLLPPQEQDAFQFVFWAFAASLAGMVLLLLYFLLAALYFRSFRRVEIRREVILEEARDLGPMSYREWVVLAGIGFLAGGIATAQWHKIDVAFIAFAVLCILLLIGALSREDFIRRIDWAFLFLLGGMIGLLSTMSYLHLDKMLTAQLGWLGHYMREDFPLFVLMLSGVIVVVRLFIPLNSAILIFAAALMPVAEHVGFNPWLVGFLILLIAETAFFPYQSPYILYFGNITRGSLSPDEGRLRVFQGLLLGAKLVAIYVSIPFWSAIGIL